MTDPSPADDLPEGFTANAGHCPFALEGTDGKVIVLLNDGTIAGPWPAWGRGHCNWDIDPGYCCAIKAYKIAK